MRMAGASSGGSLSSNHSSSGSSDGSGPKDPIYAETALFAPPVDKDAVRHISERYDTVGALHPQVDDLSLVSDDDGANSVSTATTSTTHPEEVTEQDVLQVEAFFRSNKTSVQVCQSLANLYTGALDAGSSTPAQWELKHTGIPVLLLDSGLSRARSRKRIQIIIAERGTGFVLWQDVIDNLSNYTAVDPTFHTMYLSTDHRCLAGISFDNAVSARELSERIEVLISDPANISLSGPSTKHRKGKKNGKEKSKPALKKTDISQPCCFQHVTKVDVCDRPLFYSLSTLTLKEERLSPT